jgi:hypothetical protein
VNTIRRLLCHIFGQCADEEVADIKVRLNQLEHDVYQEKRVAWEDLMLPKRNVGNDR